MSTAWAEANVVRDDGGKFAKKTHADPGQVSGLGDELRVLPSEHQDVEIDDDVVARRAWATGHPEYPHVTYVQWVYPVAMRGGEVMDQGDYQDARLTSEAAQQQQQVAAWLQEAATETPSLSQGDRGLLHAEADELAAQAEAGSKALEGVSYGVKAETSWCAGQSFTLSADQPVGQYDSIEQASQACLDVARANLDAADPMRQISEWLALGDTQ